MILVLLLGRITDARTRAIAIAALAASLLLASGNWSPAFAQTVPTGRFAADLTVGVTSPATSFTQNVTFEQYSETGTLTSAYTGGGSLSFDGGVTVRLWRGFGVSVAGSHFSDAGTAQVSASVPNPIAFNQPRQISGPAPVTHTETAAHVDASYWMQATPQLSVIVYGGPSFMHVAQDFVTDVTYTETFPYTTATYQGADTMREHGSVTGFNVGGEAGYRIFGGLSVVGAVRYSHAHVSFTDALADPMPIGGVHVGGGVRFGF